jgi:hypothetical protein
MSGGTKTDKLPHGARGIQEGDFVIEFGTDKVILLSRSRSEHYTLQAGNNSGVLDVHRTWRDEGGTERHETIFAMRRDDLLPLLQSVASPIHSGFLRLLRRLRIGWMARHGISVVRGLEFSSLDDIAAVTTKNQRRRLVVEEEKVRTNLGMPRYLDDVWDFPDGPFSMSVGHRRIGIAWKVTDKFGRARLFWIKLRDLKRFGNQFGGQVIQAALRYAIPPEQYAEYAVLSEPAHEADGKKTS